MIESFAECIKGDRQANKVDDLLHGPSESFQIGCLRRQATLLAFVCSVSVAAPVQVRSETTKAGPRNCKDPITGIHAAFGLQRTLEYSKRYLKMHQLAQAIPCLENAHAMDATGDPVGLTVAYDLGLAYLQVGEAGAARELIEDQLKIENKPELHDLLGAIESKQQHFHAAATQYQIAAQMDPSEQNIFDFATSLAKFEGDSAEKIFRYGTAKYPDSVKLHVGLGAALYARGKSVEAAHEMCVAARLDPTDPHPMEMVGATEQVPPSLEGEIAARFADLVRQYPHNAKLLYYYAMTLSGLWSGRAVADPRAITLLNRVLTLDPRLAQAYFSLAQIEEQQKQYAEAVVHYRRAAELDGTNDRYLYRLAFAYKEDGNGAMFQKTLQKFRTIHQQKKSE